MTCLGSLLMNAPRVSTRWTSKRVLLLAMKQSGCTDLHSSSTTIISMGPVKLCTRCRSISTLLRRLCLDSSTTLWCQMEPSSWRRKVWHSSMSCLKWRMMSKIQRISRSDSWIQNALGSDIASSVRRSRSVRGRQLKSQWACITFR